MKRTLYILSVFLLCLRAPAFAGGFVDASSAFAVDFPAGWTAGRSDDPSMVLKLEKGRSFFEFSKLDSELSEYYLKARVKEQVDSLRGKGNTIAGEIRQAGTHGSGPAYYTAYDSMGARVYVAFFTHNGLSYAISARGLGDDEFRAAIATVRKPGDKIEAPKPKKARVYRKPKRENTEDLDAKEDEPYALAAISAISTAGTAAAENSAFLTGAEMRQATQEVLSNTESGRNILKEPHLKRTPLDLRVWGALLAIWIIGAPLAWLRVKKFQNPRLSPPPKDVPPDFFFPFIVSRDSNLKGCTYHVVTRQKQQLLASFNSEHDVYLAGALYAGVLFHVLWSFMAFMGKGEAVTGVLLALPGGSLWASLPELFLVVPLIAGISICLNQKQVLRLFDSSSNLLMEVKQEAAGCLIRDQKGKEIARVVKTGGLTARAWNFMDTDDQVVLTIRDDHPAVHVYRRLFGNMGGALRSRYGIFASERRAGFVFLDPSSCDKFQIHLDFDFARLAHPAHILASVLYIISTEKDPSYPWI